MNINLLTGADELIRRLIIVDLLIIGISLFRDFLFYRFVFMRNELYVIFICIKNKAGLIQIDLY